MNMSFSKTNKLFWFAELESSSGKEKGLISCLSLTFSHPLKTVKIGQRQQLFTDFQDAWLLI